MRLIDAQQPPLVGFSCACCWAACAHAPRSQQATCAIKCGEGYEYRRNSIAWLACWRRVLVAGAGGKCWCMLVLSATQRKHAPTLPLAARAGAASEGWSSMACGRARPERRRSCLPTRHAAPTLAGRRQRDAPGALQQRAHTHTWHAGGCSCQQQRAAAPALTPVACCSVCCPCCGPLLLSLLAPCCKHCTTTTGLGASRC